MYYLAENLEQRRQEFADRLCQMTGCSVTEGLKEVDLSIQRLFHWGAYCDKYGGSVQVGYMWWTYLSRGSSTGALTVINMEDPYR